MEDGFDFITMIVAICVAGYAAIMLDFVAHSELGWSLAQVRGSAILGVLLASATIAGGMLLSGKRGRLSRRG